MINSQLEARGDDAPGSISKGMGDQFSADFCGLVFEQQYIKGDG